MTRREDWPQALSAVIRASLSAPRQYGVHDCGLHAADAAMAVTGVDPAADLRGRYDDYFTALRTLQARRGVRSLEAWADSLYPRVERHEARRGDWALVRQPSVPGGRPHPALVVVDGDCVRGPCGWRGTMDMTVICWLVG